MPRRPKPAHLPIRQSLEDIVSVRSDWSPHLLAMVTLARAVADELDGGQTSNAALVKQFRDLLEGLNVADDGPDPIEALLSQLRDAAPA